MFALSQKAFYSFHIWMWSDVFSESTMWMGPLFFCFYSLLVIIMQTSQIMYFLSCSILKNNIYLNQNWNVCTAIIKCILILCVCFVLFSPIEFVQTKSATTVSLLYYTQQNKKDCFHINTTNKRLLLRTKYDAKLCKERRWQWGT